MYPTSYPPSSAGGWLAQGGAGISSYEYGWFSDNVTSARVVLPNGEVKEFKDKELELIADSEGITGFIRQLTIRVHKLEEISVVSFACPDAHKLSRIFQDFRGEDLPLWSVLFINPRMAELKNRAPLRTHHDYPVEQRVILPPAYVLTLAFRKINKEKVMCRLLEILKRWESEVLPKSIAEHEWENRFKLMVVKRLGPSLVPAEVVVPLEKLGEVMEEIENEINQPVLKERVVIKRGRDGKSEVVLLGFIPADQRKFSYNFVFSLILTIIKIVKRHGGRPYSAGLFFANEAGRILGMERMERIRQFKKDMDPRNILNPDKVIGAKLISKASQIAKVFEPLVRLSANSVSTRVGERFESARRGIPAYVAWYAYACSQCGYCLDECDQFYSRNWESQSPRGKWYWLREYLEGKTE